MIKILVDGKVIAEVDIPVISKPEMIPKDLPELESPRSCYGNQMKKITEQTKEEIRKNL